MQPSNTMLARLRALAADHEPTEHDDLFGETPDDAYCKGYADGEAVLAQQILEDLARGE